MHIISGIGKMREEDHHELKANLIYIMSSRVRGLKR